MQPNPLRALCERIDALAAKATPAPWDARGCAIYGPCTPSGRVGCLAVVQGIGKDDRPDNLRPHSRADAEIIAALVTAWPELSLALRAALEAGSAGYERKTTDEEREKFESWCDSYLGSTGRIASRNVLADVRSCERALQATAAELAEARERERHGSEVRAAIRQSRDEYAAMVDRLVPMEVRAQDGTIQNIERWLAGRIELDATAVGRACIDAIIAGSMVDVDSVLCEHQTHVFKWNGNAAEQIGEAVKRALLSRARAT